MPISDRELWTLNFYRNSELHGALFMGRLARNLPTSALLAHATRHCATEARHAAMLSTAIEAVGGTIDPRVPTVQEHYAAKGGIPASLVDLLVLSEVLEKRVLLAYREHAARPDLHPEVRRTLEAILVDMEEEAHGDEESWIEVALDQEPKDHVEAAEKKWKAVDAAVIGELAAATAARFPAAGAR